MDQRWLFAMALTIQNMYTELRWGSKKAVVVVRNSKIYLQTLQKKTPVGRAVVVLPVPKQPRGSVAGGGWWSPGSSYSQIDYQAKAWETIQWTGFEWVRFLAPGAGGCHLPAPGQVPWCVFVGSCGIGLYPFYQAHNKSDRWHSL